MALNAWLLEKKKQIFNFRNKLQSYSKVYFKINIVKDEDDPPGIWYHTEYEPDYHGVYTLVSRYININERTFKELPLWFIEIDIAIKIFGSRLVDCCESWYANDRFSQEQLNKIEYKKRSVQKGFFDTFKYLKRRHDIEYGQDLRDYLAYLPEAFDEDSLDYTIEEMYNFLDLVECDEKKAKEILEDFKITYSDENKKEK